MLRATLRIQGSPSAAESLAPESGRELPRTRASVSSEGDWTVVTIEADDVSAMRAAVNSYLECISVVQQVENIAKVRQ